MDIIWRWIPRGVMGEHNLRNIALTVALALIAGAANAGDFFQDGKPREIPFNTPLTESDTAGGYTLYPGEGKWLLEKAGTASTSGPGSIVLGTVTARQDEAGVLFARLYTVVNLNQGEGSSWSGSPCGPGHLVTKNKGQGRYDNCMTIDPYATTVGDKVVATLAIRITNTAGSGRYYTTNVYLNPALLGFRDTGVGDWSEEVIKSQPNKAAFIARLTTWAEKLQDASIKAFAFSKPQDTYKDVPSWRTLMPIPESLAQANHSWGFLSAVMDIQNKSGFKALAYSQWGEGKTRWGNAWGFTSQEGADKSALSNCENGRAPSAPACKLYVVN
jgi:hypothetical protein